MTETYVFEFGERKIFEIDGEELRTDRYGHCEVAEDSFLAGMVVGAKDVHTALRALLIEHEKKEADE